MSCRHAPLHHHRGLVALSVGGAVLEAIFLLLVGRGGDLALAAQVTAPPPWGVVHDVRWLLTFQPSWWAVAGELVALLAFRGAITAVTVRAAWPRGDELPSWRRALRRALAFTTGALLVMTPWATLLFGAAVTPVSWVWIAGIVPTVAMATVVNRGAIAGQWWQLPSWRTVVFVLTTFVVLSAVGAVCALAPAPVAVVAAALGGLWNAWAWHGFLHVELCVRPRPSLPLAPAAIAAFVAAMFGGALIGFDVVLANLPTAREAAPGDGTEGDRPVLVASGFGTGYDGSDEDVLPAPYHDVRFSYVGLGAGGDPLPYDSADTHAPLPVLAQRMARQVRALHERTGRPVDIVAESEGSLVAQLYALGSVDPPVGRVVLLSPLLSPGRVHYPPAGTGGWGVGTGWVLRGMVRLITLVSPYGVTADAPFVRSIVDHAPVMRSLYACAASDVDEAALISLADETTFPMDTDSEIEMDVVAAFHARFLTGDAEPVVALLEGEPLPVSAVSTPVHVGVRALAQAWQVPELPLPLAWPREPDSCHEVEGWAEALVATAR